jgi:hypothetical protein
MSHDETNTADDKAVARALLGHAVVAEPPLDMDPRMLRRAAHRRLSRRRAVITASTALGVIAAVGAAVLVSHHENVPITAPIPPAPPVTCPANGCESQVPPASTGDERSRRLTAALAGADIIPPDMTVEPDPGKPTQPLRFVQEAGDSYQASAQLRDSHGYGRVAINVTSSKPVSDVLRCAAIKTKISCSEKALPDGGKARVVTLPGPVAVPASVLKWLTVVRPGGSFLEAYVDNSGTVHPPGSPPAPPSRDEPPLDDAALLQIARTPGLTY